MGVVIINGQKYDSMTGLRIDQADPAPELIEIETEQSQILESAPKQRRRSKQERLAEAVAREFDDDELGEQIAREIIAEVTAHEVPEWINQFTETQSTEQNAIIEQPAWITNYTTGGDPIEIQPIGLEAAARDAAQEQQTELARSTPQHLRRTQQHSSTLNRDFVKKPSYAAQNFAHKAPAPITKHPDVRRFAPIDIDAAETTNDTKIEASFAPVMTHSMEEKLAASAATVRSESTPSDLKNALISEQMSQPIDTKSRAKAEKKASRVRRRFAASTLVTAALAVLVLGGYFTYINMPSISVRVAAARAGVDAHTPYTPSGYSIDGPVAYSPGRVTINYRSNGGGEGYSFTQQKNTWGDNVITDTLVDGNDYTTLQAGKVTIYRYGDNAAWIRSGILFTLNGNESLGDNQITRIAESV